MNPYRNDTEVLRARIVELEAEVASLRPPTGPKRWRWSPTTPLLMWQVPVMHLTLMTINLALGTAWQWRVWIAGVALGVLMGLRRVPT